MRAVSFLGSSRKNRELRFLPCDETLCRKRFVTVKKDAT